MVAPRGVRRTGSQALGRYTLVAKLAAGGMAEIFAAFLQGPGGFGKLLAIKQLLPHLARDPQAVEMFLEEARILGRLSHPNISQVFELGEDEGDYFIALEYLEGVTLSRLIRKLSRPRTLEEIRLVAGLFEQACAALHHVHELRNRDGTDAGVVHRDVSPRNLFVTTDGALKLLDFGIAKSHASRVETHSGLIKGTSAYMSPEQVAGERLDRRSDVFSLGVILHELLTGEWLFRRESSTATYRAIREDTLPGARLPAPAVSKELNQVILTALARERDSRYPSVAVFGGEVARALAPIGGPLSPLAIGAWLCRRFHETLEARRSKLGDALDEALDTYETPAPLVLTPTSHAAHPQPHSAPPREESAAPVAAPAQGEPEIGVASPRRRGVSLALVFALGLLPGLAAALFAVSDEEQDPPRSAKLEAPAVRGPEMRSEERAPADGDAPRPAGQEASPRTAGPGAGDELPPVSDPSAGAPASTAPGAVAKTRPPARERAEAERQRAAESDSAADERAKTAGRESAENRREPGPEPGFFTIDSRPYARILVDGERLGVTPLLKVPLSPGKHRITAVLPDGRTQSLAVEIEPGKEAKRRRLRW